MIIVRSDLSRVATTTRFVARISHFVLKLQFHSNWPVRVGIHTLIYIYRYGRPQRPLRQQCGCCQAHPHCPPPDTGVLAQQHTVDAPAVGLSGSDGRVRDPPRRIPVLPAPPLPPLPPPLAVDPALSVPAGHRRDGSGGVQAVRRTDAALQLHDVRRAADEPRLVRGPRGRVGRLLPGGRAGRAADDPRLRDGRVVRRLAGVGARGPEPGAGRSRRLGESCDVIRQVAVAADRPGAPADPA